MPAKSPAHPNSGIMSQSKSNKPSMVVVVPALREVEFTRSLANYPALLRFLMRSRHEASEINCAEQAALHFQGYAQVDAKALPAGLCGFLADNVEQPGSKQSADGRSTTVVRADPAYVKAEPDHASIHSAAALRLSQSEAEELVAGLNSHFQAETDYRFHLGDHWRWYITGVEGASLQAEPLSQVADRNVVTFLDPQRHPVEWRQLLTEIQMVLHALPVNAERIDRGQQPINSLWVWGGHPLPERLHTPDIDCFADDAFSSGLSQLSGIQNLPLQQSAQAVAGGRQSTLIVARFLEMLLLQQVVASPGDFSSPDSTDHTPSLDTDGIDSLEGGFAWLDQLLEQGMKKLIRGKIAEIHLLACDSQLLRLRRIDLLRFWSRKI